MTTARKWPEAAWRRTWQADLQRVLGKMHPEARQKFEHYGPSWPTARSLFTLAARTLSLEVAYIAFIMEEVELRELAGELREA